MIVELTKEDCHNVRLALRITMKQAEVTEDAMKQLLMLSDKFIFVEKAEAVEEIKP